MAMIQCGECGRAISDKSEACVGCGAPTARLPGIHALPTSTPRKALTRAQVKRRACTSLAALLIGVAWASLVDETREAHRLGLFCAALFIIAGICGLLLALVHSTSAK